MEETVNDIERNQHLIENEPSILLVDNLSDLFNAKVIEPVRCVLFQRKLAGDYDGLAVKLMKTLGFISRGGARLEMLEAAGKVMILTEEEGVAFNQICSDLKAVPLNNKGLRIIPPYGYGKNNPVNDFHQDGGGPKGRCLAAYNVAGSDVLSQRDGIVYKDPCTLLTSYIPREGANIIHLPIRAIWRQTVNNNGLIHRAPKPDRHSAPRLLLIAS